MEFGELLMIVIQNDTAVYFVMDTQEANYHPEYHMWKNGLLGCNVLKSVTL